MHIDYHQLGLEYKLFSCEILHNRGLCYLYLGDRDLGRKDIEMAIQEKQTPEHERISDALSSKKWRKCEFFQLQPGKIFRPSSDKIKNVKKKDYLGKSALISSVDNSDTHTGFKGAAERRVVFSTKTRRKSNRLRQQVRPGFRFCHGQPLPTSQQEARKV